MPRLCACKRMLLTKVPLADMEAFLQRNSLPTCRMQRKREHDGTEEAAGARAGYDDRKHGRGDDR